MITVKSIVHFVHHIALNTSLRTFWSMQDVLRRHVYGETVPLPREHMYVTVPVDTAVIHAT